MSAQKSDATHLHLTRKVIKLSWSVADWDSTRVGVPLPLIRLPLYPSVSLSTTSSNVRGAARLVFIFSEFELEICSPSS